MPILQAPSNLPQIRQNGGDCGQTERIRELKWDLQIASDRAAALRVTRPRVPASRTNDDDDDEKRLQGSWNGASRIFRIIVGLNDAPEGFSRGKQVVPRKQVVPYRIYYYHTTNSP